MEKQTIQMDRVIEKKNSTFKIGVFVSTILAILIWIGSQWISNLNQTVVPKSKLQIGTVIKGTFTDYVLATGTVLPTKSVFIDAVEGGIIQDVYLESGAEVKAGDVIMQLSNSNLQLEVLNREAQLYEQINNLRNTRLLLDQNALNLKNQLADFEYQLNVLKPELERATLYFQDGIIAEKEYQQTKEQYEYYRTVHQTTYRSYQKDSITKQTQLKQLEESEKRMWKSLEAVGRITENLVIKAPIEGQLSTTDWKKGQSISQSQRIGQVDDNSMFMVRAKIDEVYLGRTQIGQIASFTISEQSYELKLEKIYPSISNGFFEAEFQFVDQVPPSIKRGRTFHLKLAQGNDDQYSILLPNGSFYQYTGGKWIYLINEEGDIAKKKEIKIGRNNPRFYEVLDGLQEGDQVLLSGYKGLQEYDKLILE